METVSCIFCNRKSDQVVIEENGYKGRKCLDCELIYISPRPSLSEIQNLYSYDHAQASTGSYIFGSFWKRLHARHNLRIITKYIKKGSLLEIGPSDGDFLVEARKKGFEVFGIELNNIKADFITNDLSIKCEKSPLNEASFCSKKFDIIYHCDVLSHFYDPVEEYKKINRNLKNRGLLIFETGNLGNVNKKYYRYISKFQYPDHLFFFSEDNLRELLRITGFELIKIYRFSTLLELVILKILKKPIDFIKKRKADKNQNQLSQYNENSDISNSLVISFSLKEILKDLYHCLLYLVSYKAGYLLSKKGRPQTVIVIAKKNSNLYNNK